MAEENDAEKPTTREAGETAAALDKVTDLVSVCLLLQSCNLWAQPSLPLLGILLHVSHCTAVMFPYR